MTQCCCQAEHNIIWKTAKKNPEQFPHLFLFSKAKSVNLLKAYFFNVTRKHGKIRLTNTQVTFLTDTLCILLQTLVSK